MPEAQDFGRRLVEHLEHVRRVVRITCRRQGFSDVEAEDCASWVLVKLVENDYAILRRFRGESSMPTYLTIVIVRLVRDYRVQQWGRWRPSAAAKRLGSIAVRLETLIYRDSLSFDEASRMIQNASEIPISVRALTAIFANLPLRGRLRPREVRDGAIDLVEYTESADAASEQEEREHEASTLEALVAEQLQQFPTEDRVVLRMTCMEGLSVADVARGLSIPQKPLYRQIERLKRALRERLEAAGVTRERVVALVQESVT